MRNKKIELIQKESQVPTFSAVGKLDLEELLGVISLVDIVISNNTGPAHMAVALGKPLVDLYARTNPQDTPWEAKSRTLYFDIPLPNDKSYEQLPPKTIVAAVEELIEGKQTSYLHSQLEYEKGQAHMGHYIYTEKNSVMNQTAQSA